MNPTLLLYSKHEEPATVDSKPPKPSTVAKKLPDNPTITSPSITGAMDMAKVVEPIPGLTVQVQMPNFDDLPNNPALVVVAVKEEDIAARSSSKSSSFSYQNQPKLLHC